MAEEAKQAKRDDDLHVLAEAARDRLGSGPTIKPMDEYTTQVECLKVLMTSGATDLAITEVEEREYTQLRSTLLREGRFKKLAPKFVMTCGSLKEFKRHMQTISDNYKGRRENIKSEFRELISSLFEDRSALDPVEDIAQHLDRPKLDLLPNDIQDRGNEMAEVYVYLYCIENSFRIFIGDIMTREQVNFPTKVRDTIAKLKAQETTTPYLPVRGENDLYYCDFIQLGQIMVSNWAVFQKHFPQRNEHWLNGKMDELYQIRCLVAHNSYVGQHERDALKVHYRIIMKQLRIL